MSMSIFLLIPTYLMYPFVNHMMMVVTMTMATAVDMLPNTVAKTEVMESSRLAGGAPQEQPLSRSFQEATVARMYYLRVANHALFASLRLVARASPSHATPERDASQYLITRKDRLLETATTHKAQEKLECCTCHRVSFFHFYSCCADDGSKI
jgi:hypothetical protein